MHLQQIRAVGEIWRTGSITRAARNLYMGQPNLSRLLQEVEEEVGFPIFRRSAKGVEPTADGLLFLHRAQEVERAMEHMERTYGAKRKVPVRILIPQAFYAVTSLADFLSWEARQAPGAGHTLPHLSMEEEAPEMIEEKVKQNEQILGLIRYEKERAHALHDRWQRQGLYWEELFTFHEKVTMAQNHPLAEKATIRREELQPFTELRNQYDHTGLGREETSTGTEKNVLTVPDRYDQLQILKQVPGAYLWAGPLPQKMLRQYGLCQKTVGQQEYCDAFLMRETRYLPMFTRKWMQYLHRWIPQNLQCGE